MFKLVSAALAAAFVAGSAVAAPVGAGTATVRVADLDPAKPEDAQRLDRRLKRAAMEACGAYEGSVRILKMAVERSDCYRETLADARAHVGAVALAQR